MEEVSEDASDSHSKEEFLRHKNNSNQQKSLRVHFIMCLD